MYQVITRSSVFDAVISLTAPFVRPFAAASHC